MKILKRLKSEWKKYVKESRAGLLNSHIVCLWKFLSSDWRDLHKSYHQVFALFLFFPNVCCLPLLTAEKPVCNMYFLFSQYCYSYSLFPLFFFRGTKRTLKLFTSSVLDAVKHFWRSIINASSYNF